MHLTVPCDARHPAAMASLRFLIAAWMAVLTALLCSIGDWWGVVLLLPAGLACWAGWHVLRGARS